MACWWWSGRGSGSTRPPRGGVSPGWRRRRRPPVALLAAGRKDEAIEALLAARQWPIHVFEYTFQALTTLADALLNGHADQVIAAVEPMRGLSRSTGRAPSWPRPRSAPTRSGCRGYERHWTSSPGAAGSGPPPALDGCCAPPELPYRGHDGRRRRFPDTLRAFGVTRREADILGLLAAGLTNADIAARLYLSVRTVESHVSSLLANSAPGIEPTSPPATWNGSDVKDGDAETACHQPESIPPRSSARYIGWAVAVPARHWLDGGCQCAQGFLDLEVGYDPSGRMSQG